VNNEPDLIVWGAQVPKQGPGQFRQFNDSKKLEKLIML